MDGQLKKAPEHHLFVQIEFWCQYVRIDPVLALIICCSCEISLSLSFPLFLPLNLSVSGRDSILFFNVVHRFLI